MKLDPTVMRTMSRQDFRVLAAVESGMKSHSLVPAALITSSANLRHGGTAKILSSLLRDKLLSHDQSCGYDGYRLTNCGYDILALHNLKTRGIIAGLGDRIGTGKESDVYVAITPQNTQIVLKFHRLGRTSFRDVKKKRDYFMVNALSKNKKQGTQYRTLPNSWLFLSRTSALKEYAFMKSLYDVGYPTPRPVAQNRHVVAMGLVRGVPLYQLHTNRVSAEQAESIFRQSALLAGRLAQHGLVHCDLNEFNLMVDLSGVQARIARTKENVDGEWEGRDWDDDATEHYVRHSGLPVQTKGALSAHGPLQKHHIDGTGEAVTEAPPEPLERLENGEPKPIVTLIDFPQMVSTRHPNARELYERDVICLKNFFGKKLRCFVEGEIGEDNDAKFGGIMPTWEELIAEEENGAGTSGGDGADDVTLISKAQLRLDEELKASGYSEEDAARDSELAYYEAHQQMSRTLGRVDDVDEDDSDDNDDDSYDEDRSAEDKLEEPTDNDCNDFGSVNEEDQTPELVDMGTFNPQSKLSRRGDVASYAGGVSLGGLSQLNYAEAEQRARERVKRHLEENKRKSGKKGAFKTRNSNKSYVKGKRVLNEFGI
ncbi:hypothetical protein ACHAW6_016149 [Cyclotella cf. meneghiniana]